jgi:long-chain acyl-CoA synthetase
VEKHGCTFLPSLPTLLQFILDEQERAPRRMASLRAGASSGDAVSVALQNRFQRSFGIPLQELYCMTESLPMMLNPRNALRPGSLGRPAYGVEARLIDSSGREVPMGETGEIAVRSPANCIGYWNDPKSTSAALGDGLLRTGDLACCDTEGYYWFQGRKKEIIIRAGSNISPQEVEEALYRHPAVREAGVVGIPDPVYGEIVAACVVLREGKSAGAAELQNFACEFLADYKVPARIVYLEELPKSPTGKVQRRALKERLLSDSAVPASR